MNLKSLNYDQSDLSLSESHGSVSVPTRNGFKKFLAFLGPGYLVAVGYMDPGNWATSIAGGSQFGYQLLFIALMSNIMAILLQALCARLGIGSGRDLAQACRDNYPKPLVMLLWVLAEIAIIATDLAEVIGTAIGLNLLFGIPLEIGVVITALDVFLILWFQKRGFRYLEGLVISLLVVIMACFGVQIFMADPDWAKAAVGFLPSREIFTNPEILYLALGIIGATVMPHNLYLHSSIVQTRRVSLKSDDRRNAIRYATLDSTIALMLALLVNASILILAAATFHNSGLTNVVEIEKAHSILSSLLNSGLAPTLFAIALLCCGLNSTVTATLSGQIVMEGFIKIRLEPWIRRLITRGLAIIPAAVVTIMFGINGTAKLLILSQVILSFQLPFAIVPLVFITAKKTYMNEHITPKWQTILASLVAVIVIALNIKVLLSFIL
jgi:manganese transport protein